MVDPDIILKYIHCGNFIKELFYFAEMESTNNFAKKNKLPQDSLIITNHQISGRGRLDRKWESEKNKNLTFSIVKKIDIEPFEQVNLIYYTSYSVYTALLKYPVLKNIQSKNLDFSIKWPNDILLNNKKVSGNLIESKPLEKLYIIGVGINVNQIDFSKENINIVTSLNFETGFEFDLNDLFKEIINCLSTNIKFIEERKFSKIYNLWKNRIVTIGKDVSFIDKNGQISSGKLIDILPSGKIIIEENGKKCTFNSEEIKLINLV